MLELSSGLKAWGGKNRFSKRVCFPFPGGCKQGGRSCKEPAKLSALLGNLPCFAIRPRREISQAQRIPDLETYLLDSFSRADLP